MTLDLSREFSRGSLWRTATIGEVAEVIMGQAPPGSSYNEDQLGSPLIAGANDLGSIYPAPTRWTTKPTTLSQVGDIIICVRATIGDLNWSDSEYCLGRGVAAIRPQSDVIVGDFLFFWLAASREYLTRLGTGSTFMQIRRQDIDDAPIPLPPLPEQHRIVETLRAADELRRLRAQANRRAQELLPALFHEMFATTADEATAFSELASVADVVSGVAKGRRLRSRKVREVPYIRVANVQDGFLDLSEVKTIEALETEIDLYRLQHHDVLLTEGGDFDKLGRGALWEADILDCIHQNHIFRVRLNQNKVRPQFFVQYLQTPFVKSYFLRAAKRTTNLASINLTQLCALPVPVISTTDQDQFVIAATQARQISLECMNSAQRIDELFQSLLTRAFTGELTAAWRGAHHEELVRSARKRDEFLRQKTTAIASGPSVEQLALPLTQPKRTIHAALDKPTAALLAAAEARPAYFRADDLVGDSGLDLVQTEAGLRLLAALGFVRAVQLGGRRIWRLVDAINESVEKPQELPV